MCPRRRARASGRRNLGSRRLPQRASDTFTGAEVTGSVLLSRVGRKIGRRRARLNPPRLVPLPTWAQGRTTSDEPHPRTKSAPRTVLETYQTLANTGRETAPPSGKPPWSDSFPACVQPNRRGKPHPVDLRSTRSPTVRASSPFLKRDRASQRGAPALSRQTSVGPDCTWATHGADRSADLAAEH